MNWLANAIMERRAKDLYHRVKPWLPVSGTIADLGSGTGHNAEQIRRRTGCTVQEYDVVDLHWVGPGPVLIDRNVIPAADHTFASLLLLFVLQYPESVCQVLNEVRRVTRGRVIVVQSTYTGVWGRLVLKVREFAWGRLAFHLAVLFGLVHASRCSLVHASRCSVVPQRHFTTAELIDVFHQSKFIVREIHRSRWRGFCVSRDLFVLEADL